MELIFGNFLKKIFTRQSTIVAFFNDLIVSHKSISFQTPLATLPKKKSMHGRSLIGRKAAITTRVYSNMAMCQIRTRRKSFIINAPQENSHLN